MTKIVWDEVGSRGFEAGLDRGVLYLEDGSGVPWNGLISVREQASASSSPVHYDGRKIDDIVSSKSFVGTMRAYTYPDEFLEYEGVIEDSVGLLLTEQPFKRFSLSYRTKIGNDIEGIDQGYRIHIVYGLIAIPSIRSYQTLALNVEPTEFEWTISGVSKEISGFKPTSHVIIDTSKVPSWFITDIEDILYGTDEDAPYLPSLQSLASFFRNWDRILIFDNQDGTWTAVTTREDAITDYGDGSFEIIDANAVYLDAYTYEVSSTDRSEEDLWQL